MKQLRDTHHFKISLKKQNNIEVLGRASHLCSYMNRIEHEKIGGGGGGTHKAR
jgi:hypothetical protein